MYLYVPSMYLSTTDTHLRVQGFSVMSLMASHRIPTTACFTMIENRERSKLDKKGSTDNSFHLTSLCLQQQC